MRRSLSFSAAVIVLLAGAAADARAIRHGNRRSTSRPPTGRSSPPRYYAGDQPGPGILLLHQCNRDRSVWRRPGGEPRPRRLPRAHARLPRLRRQRRQTARHADGPGARPGRDRGLAGRRRRRLCLSARPARSPERFRRRRRELRRQPVDPALAAPPGGQVARASLGDHRPRGPAAPAQQSFAAAHARGLGRRRRRGRVHDVARRVLRQSQQPFRRVQDRRPRHRPVRAAPGASGRDRRVVRRHARRQGEAGVHRRSSAPRAAASPHADDDRRARWICSRRRDAEHRAQDGRRSRRSSTPGS